MQEERMTILKMVAEKKITAEEAAKLLEALGASGSKSDQPHDHDQADGNHDNASHRRSHQKQGRKANKSKHRTPDWQGQLNDLSNNLSSLFGDVGGMFGKQGIFGEQGDFSFHQKQDPQQYFDVKEGVEVEVENTAGKLTVKGVSDDRIRVASEGFRFKAPQIDVDEEANEIHINTLGQHMVLDIPQHASRLKLNTTGGKMVVGDLQADCDIQITGGRLQGHSLQGNHHISVTGGVAELDAITSSELFVNLQGGSINLRLEEINVGLIDIKIHGGHGVICLPAHANCNIDVTMERGDIISDIPGDHQKEGNKAFFKAVCGQGTAMVRIDAHRGQVEVKIDE